MDKRGRFAGLLGLGCLFAVAPAAAQDFDYRQVVEAGVDRIENETNKRLMIVWGEEPRSGWLDVRRTRSRSQGLMGCVTLHGGTRDHEPIYLVYVIDDTGDMTGNPYTAYQLARFLAKAKGISHDPGCTL